MVCEGSATGGWDGNVGLSIQGFTLRYFEMDIFYSYQWPYLELKDNETRLVR